MNELELLRPVFEIIDFKFIAFNKYDKTATIKINEYCLINMNELHKHTHTHAKYAQFNSKRKIIQILARSFCLFIKKTTQVQK